MSPLRATISRQWSIICSRRIYVWAMVIIPVAFAVLLLSLMSSGLPNRAPVGVVDLDNSSMSRQITRDLNALEVVDVVCSPPSFHHAIKLVDQGEIYGFFFIPDNFQRDAVGGRTPSLSFYADMTYFIPGTLSFKGFKTVAVSTSGSMVRTELTSVGVDGDIAATILQPMTFVQHPLNNPWTNYSIYLSNSFIPGMLELMIMLLTAFSVGQEVKQRTSVEWLSTAGGSILTAVTGKLLPQTAIFTLVGWAIQLTMYGPLGYPLNCPLWVMLAAMLMMVVASQALGLLAASLLNSLRMSMSVMALFGILGFSLAGFSFPVENMYGGFAILSYILPVRYYFLIYVDQALNGVPLWYDRWYFTSLMVFPLLSGCFLWLLKRYCKSPVYLP